MNAISYFNQKNVKGTVKFHQCNQNSLVIVTFDLKNLTPNRKRAIHIHEYGDTSGGCKTLGAHWNPLHKDHGHTFLNSHTGDLINNITPNKNGVFKYRYIDPRLSLYGDVSQSIIGRSVVIHNGVDDLGLGGDKESKITGNAGDRMACAIIGLCE